MVSLWLPTYSPIQKLYFRANCNCLGLLEVPVTRPTVALSYTGARTIEISIVRKVESLSAELQLRRLRYRKLLGKRHGDASEVISSQYPRARVTVCEVGMYRETALV